MNNQPLLVGITGGIGAGKSIISKIFMSLGIPVYNADNRAKWLMTNNQILIKEIKNLFGPKSYVENGQLNSGLIAKAVFNDSKKINELNQLVHPKVGEDFNTWVQKQSDAPYLLKEAALLFESGSYKQLDAVINVSAPENIRIERVLKRDIHRSKDQVIEIIAKQISEKERIKMADYLILNDGYHMVIPQVKDLHKKLTNKKKI